MTTAAPLANTRLDILRQMSAAIRLEFERSVAHFDDENPLWTDRKVLSAVAQWMDVLMRDTDAYDEGETHAGFHRALSLIRTEPRRMMAAVGALRTRGNGQ
jgi:hypothetical protein